jgi:NAD(P)H-dependent flavin oxidoreductase YrpB (nitropropane dioxygenase family)
VIFVTDFSAMTRPCAIAPRTMTKILQLEAPCSEKMSSMNSHPTIIQGGMGAGISNWMLARAVSQLGQLGVVSGKPVERLRLEGPEGSEVNVHVNLTPEEELSESRRRIRELTERIRARAKQR